MMKPRNLKEEFERYINAVYLGATLSEVQRLELLRAFVAGAHITATGLPRSKEVEAILKQTLTFAMLTLITSEDGAGRN